jgi:hypothetical protein
MKQNKRIGHSNLKIFCNSLKTTRNEFMSRTGNTRLSGELIDKLRNWSLKEVL